MKCISRALLGALLLLAVPAIADDISNGSYSTTDGGNNAAPPNGWPAGMFPNQVEPSARANMGATARWWERANAKLSTAGSAGAYTLTPSNPTYPTAYTQGEIYCAKANFTSVGADTLNVNALGAKALFINNGSALAQIPAGAIFTGQQFCAAYDGALNSGAGGFQLISAFSPAGYLKAANNLSDIVNASTARSNLNLGTSATKAVTDNAQSLVASVVSAAANRLFMSDGNGSLINSAILYTDVLNKQNNLSDLTNNSTARSNLGLGSAAVKSTTDGSVTSVAGVVSAVTNNLYMSDANGSLISSGIIYSDVMNKQNNLSDLTNVATARSSLGLKNGATTTVTASSSAPSGSGNNGDIWIQY